MEQVQQVQPIQNNALRLQSPHLDSQIAKLRSLAPSQVSSIQEIYSGNHSPMSYQAQLGRKIKPNEDKKLDENSQTNTITNQADDMMIKFQSNASVHPPLNSGRGMKVQIQLKN